MNHGNLDTHADGGIVEVNLDDLLASLTFDDTVPDDREAAAVAAAVAAHRTERERAAAEATAATGGEPETVPEWVLAGRFDSSGVNPRRRPRHVQRGREWQAAARSL